MKWLTHESAEGLLAITSLARSLGGEARLSDVGGLLWMVLRQSVPCDAMAVFLIDDDRGHVTVRFAAGNHAVHPHLPERLRLQAGSQVARLGVGQEVRDVAKARRA